MHIFLWSFQKLFHRSLMKLVFFPKIDWRNFRFFSVIISRFISMIVWWNLLFLPQSIDKIHDFSSKIISWNSLFLGGGGESIAGISFFLWSFQDCFNDFLQKIRNFFLPLSTICNFFRHCQPLVEVCNIFQPQIHYMLPQSFDIISYAFLWFFHKIFNLFPQMHFFFHRLLKFTLFFNRRLAKFMIFF